MWQRDAVSEFIWTSTWLCSRTCDAVSVNTHNFTLAFSDWESTFLREFTLYHVNFIVIVIVIVIYFFIRNDLEIHTPNANMADHSVGARDESHGSEVSQALVFCFDNAFPAKSCFVVDLAFLFRPLYSFLCCRMPPQESEIFHSRESVLFFSYLVRLLGETKETEARS